MTLLQPRSLQLRLAIRLGALLLVSTLLAAGIFLYLSYRTADSLSMRALFRLSEELAESIERDRSLEPISELAERGLLQEDTVFAIRDAYGRLIAASDEEIGGFATMRARASRRPRFFRLDAFGPDGRVYYGFDLRERSAIGPVSVLVAKPDDAEDELLMAMLDEIVFAAAWIIPIFVAATLLVGVFALRSGLKPLRESAEQAARIQPAAMSVRLATEDLPSEVLPFVGAVNRALDRLEEGFDLQRQFTANAAHELRTPLAIITAALDDLEVDGKVTKLEQDVARMNRLVEQLLLVARLDSIVLDVSMDVDLRECARETVEYLAPLAIGQQRSIALSGAESQVLVKGNRHAIGDVLRNLIENALLHTPPHTEVAVDVSVDGSVSVCDRGKGVAVEDRVRIFDRFWRGQGRSGTGAGLGLAIVKEILDLHGGEIFVSDNPGGGSCFTARFRAG